MELPPQVTAKDVEYRGIAVHWNKSHNEWTWEWGQQQYRHRFLAGAIKRIDDLMKEACTLLLKIKKEIRRFKRNKFYIKDESGQGGFVRVRVTAIERTNTGILTARIFKNKFERVIPVCFLYQGTPKNMRAMKKLEAASRNYRKAWARQHAALAKIENLRLGPQFFLGPNEQSK